ncbi:MAG: EscU/YscU/HrcU family type III secretion system export apparatus switch protein [Azonexus sp.]|nr:EscU/YscU/HrcU family type III secretion system export apparatus switch protein [Azonexus sp.]MCK6411285.1 EscU/YscU/HrcU family type III secretion system export apparatus switch protein [Azonexus sp.]
MTSPKPSALREAVALAYGQTDPAPRVVARGKGVIAEQIIAKAREHGVYVHESVELVALLTQVDIDEHIPAQLYLAVAELLAWLYRLEQEGGKEDEKPIRNPPP